MDLFIISLCLPTADITQIFSRDSEGTSLGSVSISTTNMTEFILRADGENQTVSTKNLTHIFRRLPVLQTLIVTSMSLVNVVGAFAVLSDELHTPVLPSCLAFIYAELAPKLKPRLRLRQVLALVCCMGQRLESLPDTRLVRPASL
jgi:hypothetical protein